MARRAAFIDRDGTLTQAPRPGEYLLGLREIEILPGVSRALKLLRNAGFVNVIVTNQRCVKLGLATLEHINFVNLEVVRRINPVESMIDHIEVCPHGLSECYCRKPRPGMLFRAAAKLDLALSQSVIFGDSETDVEAGIAARTYPVRITSSDTPTKALACATTLLEGVIDFLKT